MNGSRRAVYEIMGMVLAAAFCMALAAASCLRASSESRGILVLDECMGVVQSVADAAISCRGTDGLQDVFPDGRYDGSVFVLWINGGSTAGPDGPGLSVLAGPVIRDGCLGLCRVSLHDVTGTELWAVTASWQEDVEPWGE